MNECGIKVKAVRRMEEVNTFGGFMGRNMIIGE